MQIACKFLCKFIDHHYNSIQLSFSYLPSALTESIVAKTFPRNNFSEMFLLAQL